MSDNLILDCKAMITKTGDTIEVKVFNRKDKLAKQKTLKNGISGFFVKFESRDRISFAVDRTRRR